MSWLMWGREVTKQEQSGCRTAGCTPGPARPCTSWGNPGRLRGGGYLESTHAFLQSPILLVHGCRHVGVFLLRRSSPFLALAGRSMQAGFSWEDGRLALGFWGVLQRGSWSTMEGSLAIFGQPQRALANGLCPGCLGK